MRTFIYTAGLWIWLGAGLSVLGETSGSAPLPSVESIIRRAVARARDQSDNDAFRKNYYYTWTKTTAFRDDDGDLTKEEKKEGTHDPLRKPAPRATPPSPLQPKSGAALLTTSQAPAGSKEKGSGKLLDKKDFLTDPDLLNRFDFALVGRETVNGRDALVIDFQPKTGKLPEHNLKDRILNRAAGRVWLDEEESELAKADLHLTRKVDVVGGWAGSVSKFKCSIERARTEDGLWFNRATNWHLEGRELFFPRVVDHQEETTGLRRVH